MTVLKHILKLHDQTGNRLIPGGNLDNGCYTDVCVFVFIIYL